MKNTAFVDKHQSLTSINLCEELNMKCDEILAFIPGRAGRENSSRSGLLQGVIECEV